jgi:hypothetical protein
VPGPPTRCRGFRGGLPRREPTPESTCTKKCRLRGSMLSTRFASPPSPGRPRASYRRYSNRPALRMSFCA